MYPKTKLRDFREILEAFERYATAVRLIVHYHSNPAVAIYELKN